MTASEPTAAGDQHTVTLNGHSASLGHPASCLGTADCPYAAPAAALSAPVFATGGTWTVSLHDGSLILLKRIAI